MNAFKFFLLIIITFILFSCFKDNILFNVNDKGILYGENFLNDEYGKIKFKSYIRNIKNSQINSYGFIISKNDTIGDIKKLTFNIPNNFNVDSSFFYSDWIELDNNKNFYFKPFIDINRGRVFGKEISFKTFKDSDKDGIIDELDYCSDTPNSEIADSTGCSISQKDSDSDGLNDLLDYCPNTPFKEIIDSLGCSDSQKDTDNDGVTDNLDLEKNTRKGVPVDENGVMRNPVYLDDNGITIKARDWAINGDVGKVNGENYLVVNEDTLRDLVERGENLTRLATTFVKDMSSLFKGKSKFNQNIGNWDVSNVSDMSFMFSFNSTSTDKTINPNDERMIFNQDISNWDVSNVTNMTAMFQLAIMFDQPIGKWNVSKVKYMDYMFSLCPINQNLSSWNVSNVLNMEAMFQAAYNFNSPIGKWNVSNVENMVRMFFSTTFNQKIEDWNVSKVKSMENMFYEATFNQEIEKWNVSNVIDMSNMFLGAEFNKKISNWDVSKVTNMENMFHRNKKINQDLSKWNVSNVTNCQGFSTLATQWVLPQPNFENCNTIANQSLTSQNFKNIRMIVVK